MVQDESFGIIPIAQTTTGRQYLLIQHRAGHWSFPKGHAEPSETPSQAALRELAEETGITQVQLHADGRFVEAYTFVKSGGKRVNKRVHYFVGEVAQMAVRMQPEEIADYLWADAPQARQRLTFDEGRALLDRVERWLSGQGQADEPASLAPHDDLP